MKFLILLDLVGTIDDGMLIKMTAFKITKMPVVKTKIPI